MQPSIFARRNPWTEEPERATVHGVTKKVRYDLASKPQPLPEHTEGLEGRKGLVEPYVENHR